jgi:3-oxoacyl-(acyl-carrier-protein) synthase
VTTFLSRSQLIFESIFFNSFINTVAGWVNLLLLSSSGPIKIPVGACATALQSVEIAVDTILSGKAKVMISGGFDDFSEEGSYEFANMAATSNSVKEFAAGREPNEMSRPTTSTRSGFSALRFPLFSLMSYSPMHVVVKQWKLKVVELKS